jgi:folate-dependent phosphoribosylglycinamide formyltransferase PurN
MKAFYLFHDNWYQYVKADLLASQYPITGFVVIRRKRDPWYRYLWKRAKRLGFSKVLDELALRLYWTVFKSWKDHRDLKHLIAKVQRGLPTSYKRPPVYHVENINSDAGRQVLRDLNPDVCVLMVHPILSKKTFSIPRHGMLVFHPGITPEYRGPHSAFWATMTNEFWGIGWSLLRVDEGIDTGPVLAQGSCTSVDPLEVSHVIMQHVSHIDGTSCVAQVLRRLERGETPRVEMINRRSTNYTHPGITDYIRFSGVRKKLRNGRYPKGHPKPVGVL